MAARYIDFPCMALTDEQVREMQEMARESKERLRRGGYYYMAYVQNEIPSAALMARTAEDAIESEKEKLASLVANEIRKAANAGVHYVFLQLQGYKSEARRHVVGLLKDKGYSVEESSLETITIRW